MLWQVLVTLSVAGVSPGSALGASQCSWGPAYWCANIQQASHCGAVAHCIKTVWEKETVAEDDDEVCKICKDMVGQARDTLLSNETQEELKEVFDGSCDLIPIKIIAKECRTLSDQFIPELVETLASEMNPDTVCTVSGLCNSARIDALLAEQEQQYGGDCNICREGARQVKERLTGLSQDEVTHKMMELCGYLGTFSTACMETVTENSDEIYRMLTEQFDEEICDLSGLCSQSFEKVPATTLQAGEDIQCEFCEKVIKHWIDVYASKSSLEEFKALLDGICERLDTKNAAHCKHIVDDYYIPAFEFIKNELDPHMLCSMVGLCTDSQTSKAPIISLTKLEPASRVDSLAALNGPLYLPNSVVEVNTPSCVLCEYVIDTLDDYVKDGKNEAEIKKAVESICEKMPGSIRKKCDSFIEKYEPAIVSFIVNEIESSKICSLLHLCDNQNFIQNNRLDTLSKDSNCEMCEFAMHEVFSILTNKDDQDMVKNVLESICYRLPDSIERSCEDFVEKYTSTIINLIVSGLTPDGICSALNLCTSDKAPPSPAPSLKADPSCVLCEYIITTLDTMVEDKTNKDEIKKSLEKLCSLLPSSVEDQCDTFVETYTDLIIDMLTKDVSPEMICTNLGLCKASGNVVQHRVHMKKKPYCALCEMVITQLDQVLEDKTNEAQIEQALDVVCTSLPDPVHKQCEKMVAKYTEKIIDLLVSQYTPEMICGELALCVNNDINTNSIHQVNFESEEVTDTTKETIGCEICEFAMNIVDQHLTNPSTIDEVERMVQFLCSYLPGTISDKCEEFVDQWGQKIIDLIVHDELDPTEVCGQLLPSCSSQPQVVGKSCIWGPAYWCATPYHARICATTQHCKETVWKKMNIQE